MARWLRRVIFVTHHWPYAWGLAETNGAEMYVTIVEEENDLAVKAPRLRC